MFRVIGERLSFHGRIKECANSLDESHMCVYVDGMDQDKTWIPKFAHTETDRAASDVLPCRYE